MKPSAVALGLHVKRLVAVATLSLLVISPSAVLAPSAVSAQDQTNADSPSTNNATRLDMVSQTGFVTAGNAFNLVAQITTDRDPATLDLVVTVLGSVRNRSAFNQSLNGTTTGSTQILQRFPLSEVLDPDRRVTVSLPINDAAQRATYLAASGVYPIHVELREQGTDDSLAQINSHIIKSATEEPRKLNVATAFPVNVASDDNDPFAAPSNGSEYNELAAITTTFAALPMSIAVSPEGLDRVRELENPAAQTSIQSLTAALARQPNYAQPWAPAVQSLAKELPREFDQQLEQGSNSLTETFNQKPQSGTWLGLSPLSQESATELQKRGTKQMVIQESNLTPVGRATSITRPIKIRSSKKTTVDALQGDSALTEHFRTGGVLGAHRLLADLTVLQNDFPGQERGVVAMAPADWRFDPALLNEFFGALSNSPELQGASFDKLFSLPYENNGLTRDLATDKDSNVSKTRVENARKRLDGFASMVDAQNPLYEKVTRQLLYAESSRLLGRNRDQVISEHEQSFSSTIKMIRLPTERSIRLTANQGEVPVSIQNDTGFPVRVKVRFSSDQVSFPGGHEAIVDVERQQLTKRVLIESRTSGRFPVQVSLVSPDGSLQLTAEKVNIISTSTSAVGMILTFGSLSFLIVWWIVSLVQGHKKKHAGKHAVS